EIARRFFFDIDVYNNAIRGRARIVRDLDLLEIIEVVEASFGAIDQCAIVRVTLANIEFTPDHIVPRSRVAANIDALDVNARTLLDDEREIDDLGLEVAVGSGPHVGECITSFCRFDRQAFDRLLYQIRVVNVSVRETHLGTQGFSIQRSHARADIDSTYAIL